MHVDIHVSRFDWAGGPAGIGPGVADLARRAEAMGVRALSFMDHWFQMERMAPAEDPMLEGYTALGVGAGRTQRLRLRLLVTGVTYRHPGLLAKTVTTLDVVSSGRAELGIGARGTTVNTAVSVCRSRRRPSVSSASKKRSRSVCRCGAT